MLGTMISLDYGSVVNSLLVTLGLAFLISLCLRPLMRLTGRAYDVALGALFGLAAIVSMMFGSFEVVPGIILDLRNVLVVSSGVFAGPIGAVVATVLTVLFRVFLDGNPAGGIVAIIGIGIIGAIFGHYWRQRKTAITWLQFVLVGLAVTAVNVAVPMLAIPLGWLDWDHYVSLSVEVLPTMIISYCVGMVAIGLTMRTVLTGIYAEREVLIARDDAEKSSRAKSDFLAGMSHELRTPMNAILGFGQVLYLDTSGSLSDKQQKYVGYILEGGNHLLSLINEVLDLSRIEANQTIFQIERVNVADAIQASLDMLSMQVSGQNITIVNHAKNHPDLFVTADSRRVRQILLNFVSNAIKYNNRGGAVTLDAVETDDGYCRISVADTGIGISPEDGEDIFKIFHRLENQAMTSREGNGIGLAVARMLAEQMSGRIDFHSEPGVGSTFWVELPIA